MKTFHVQHVNILCENMHKKLYPALDHRLCRPRNGSHINCDKASNLFSYRGNYSVSDSDCDHSPNTGAHHATLWH